MAVASAQARKLNVRLGQRFWLEDFQRGGKFVDRYHTHHPFFEVSVRIERAGRVFFEETFRLGEGAHSGRQNVNNISLDPFIAQLKNDAAGGDSAAAPELGPFELTLTPGASQSSAGSAGPTTGFAYGPPVVGHAFETEYRPLTLRFELDSSFRAVSVMVPPSDAASASPDGASRGPHGMAQLLNEKTRQVLDVDWRFDWLRRVRSKTRPKAVARTAADETVSVIVLHQTGNEDERHTFSPISSTLDAMMAENRSIGVHYVVDVDGHVVKLADERQFTSHTNVSSWRGETGVTKRAIGIEQVHNKQQNGVFPETQIEACVDLVQRLVREHGVQPFNVVGHADIRCIASNELKTKNGTPRTVLIARLAQGSPVLNPFDRTRCPGVAYPWEKHAEAGTALTPVSINTQVSNYTFFTNDPNGTLSQAARSRGPVVEELQRDLLRIGWPLSASHPNRVFDGIVDTVVKRFQARFLSHLAAAAGLQTNRATHLVNGVVDANTGLLIKRVIAALDALGG